MSENTSPNSIREIRTAKGLSQEALARRADCSTAYVRMLEGGYQPREAADAYHRVLAALDELAAGSDN